MSTMPSLPELPQQQNIADMLAVNFVFKTTGFPPFVLLTRLCHETYLMPQLGFQLGSYEPYRKFSTYFVSGCCFNLKCILPDIYIGNFQYISEYVFYDIFCRILLFQPRVYFVVYIYSIYIYNWTNFIVNNLKRSYKINNIFPNGASYLVLHDKR